MRKLLIMFMALLCSVTLWAQQSVTGTVTDDKGQPLPNVSVMVKGTNVGTVTAQDGTFSLVVPATGKVLVFTSVGMTPQEISINNQTSFKVTVISDDIDLQEVAVVGYGTQKKKDVTAAIGKIDPTPIASLVTPS